ncbi:MAG: hypothetical protein AAF633_21050 [Chloroflexota bacterium]
MNHARRSTFFICKSLCLCLLLLLINGGIGYSSTFAVTGSFSGTVGILGADLAETISLVETDTNAELSLPDRLASGSYAASYLDEGQRVTARFGVDGPRITVTDMGIDKPIVSVNEAAVVTADISSDEPLDVLVIGEMVDGNGASVGAYSQSHTLSSGGQRIEMPVAVDGLTLYLPFDWK